VSVSRVRACQREYRRPVSARQQSKTHLLAIGDSSLVSQTGRDDRDIVSLRTGPRRTMLGTDPETRMRTAATTKANRTPTRLRNMYVLNTLFFSCKSRMMDRASAAERAGRRGAWVARPSAHLDDADEANNLDGSNGKADDGEDPGRESRNR
jgi:hypothetical protein